MKWVTEMSIKNDKISFFSKIIYERIDEESQRESEEFKLEKEKQILELKENLEKRRNREIEKAEKKARFKANEIISDENSISKRAYMELAESLIQKTVEAVGDELLKFTETQEYENYLLEMIDQSISNMEGYRYYLYLTEQDLQKYGKKIDEFIRLKQRGGIELAVSQKPIIGGFVLEEKEKRFTLDSSLASTVESSRSHIGLKVTGVLGSGGDDA